MDLKPLALIGLTLEPIIGISLLPLGIYATGKVPLLFYWYNISWLRFKEGMTFGLLIVAIIWVFWVVMFRDKAYEISVQN